jgi:hypothetical protein
VPAFKPFQEALPGRYGLQPPRPSQAITGGAMAAFDGFGRLAPGSVQSGADVEFAKLLGAWALLKRWATLLVMKIVKFLVKTASHLQ